jgi:hypothetical protein
MYVDKTKKQTPFQAFAVKDLCIVKKTTFSFVVTQMKML